MKQTTTIALTEELKNKIDKERGMVPRSRYIEDLIKKGIEASGQRGVCPCDAKAEGQEPSHGDVEVG